MKIIMNLKQNWIKIALCSLSLANAYSFASNSVTLIKQSGLFIIKIEQELAKFFSTDNTTPYNTYTISLGKILSDFEKNIDLITRTPGDKLSNKAYEIAQEARKHFSAAFGIITQYNGKNPQEARKFADDLSVVFSTEEAFKSILGKLNSLLKDASDAEETELVRVIQQLINTLEKKNAEWNKKSKLTLLTGLTLRMGK